MYILVFLFSFINMCPCYCYCLAYLSSSNKFLFPDYVVSMWSFCYRKIMAPKNTNAFMNFLQQKRRQIPSWSMKSIPVSCTVLFIFSLLMGQGYDMIGHFLPHLFHETNLSWAHYQAKVVVKLVWYCRAIVPLMKWSVVCRAVDPHSFFVDQDPAVFLCRSSFTNLQWSVVCRAVDPH